MGPQAIGAVLNSCFRISVAAPAVLTQAVKGAVAEQAVEGLGVCFLMAGEILALPVLKKIVMCH